MPADSISRIQDQIMGYFGDVNDLGEQSDFTQRQGSALTAEKFVKCLTIGCLLDNAITLEGICQLLKQDGVTISKQGLHQRFNARTTNLMINCFNEALNRFKTQQENVLDFLKGFTEVGMLDSSGIPLPLELREQYKGCGGTHLDSSLKIQTAFNYIEGQIKDITITAGNKNDQSFQGHLDKFLEGGLYLHDLGYFKVDTFIKIQTAKAFFISRLFTKTGIYELNGKEIDLLWLLGNSPDFFSKEILLGSKQKFSVRLVATKLNKEQADRAIRKLRRDAKKGRRVVSKKSIELAKWSLSITNVPKDMIKDEHVYLAYSLRWQIELFFKLSKQEAGIDKIRGKKSDRVLCEIYAKLICIIILLYLCFPIRWQAQTEVSFPKAYKCWSKRAMDFFKALTSGYRFKKFLESLIDDFKKFALKDIKHKNPATYEKMMKVAGQTLLVA
jgi:Transposase DDE domain